MVTVKIRTEASYVDRSKYYYYEVPDLLSSDKIYSTKGNAVRGIHRAMKQLGIKQYQIIDENEEEIFRTKTGSLVGSIVAYG